MTQTPARPFADAVVSYAQAGWPCIIPVPLKKSPPPEGFTGSAGSDTAPEQLVRWATSHAGSSIAIRMPDGVIGIDVDHYTKGTATKTGADTLAGLETRHGRLPATWTSTARGADTPSRIRFYRVPAGRYATRFPDIEIIQRHHRYAVVWPSPHPTAGSIYRWYTPDGTESDTPPKPGELPELPEKWVRALAEGAADQAPAAADRDSGAALLAQLLDDTRPACAELASAALTAVADLDGADVGSRHDTATGRVHQLVQLAAAGHTGLGRAVEPLRERWAALTAGEDRAGELDAMLLTSARKAVTGIGATSPVPGDPCAMIGSAPLPPPTPADDRPGEPAEHLAETAGRARQLRPTDYIGTDPFDPPHGLDQRLAEAVLYRAAPILRYAYDSGSWLLRGPDSWGTRGDLADWAVSLVADLMPKGDPAAPEGSDQRQRADRRRRFMSAGPSGAMAKKIRALVAGGTHPATLRIADLDTEPWLLWAGGVAWDLRRCADGPQIASVSPAEPHLHSAAVAPDVRPTPLWDAFTAAVWPDPELRAWALRVLSIAFTGHSDKALPILLGDRDRGKTQIAVLLMSVLGSYAHAADPRLLGGADRAHASIIYALMGRRLSFVDEGPRDNKAGKESLKQLTGGGQLTGNQMNRNPVTFDPTHTLVLTANEPPALGDAAVRGRVRLIPCLGDPDQVRAARAAIGHTTGEAWRAEAPGVLAAMMAQAARWLAEPDSALTSAAPEQHRYLAEDLAAEQDTVAGWLEDAVEPDDPGTASRELFTHFVQWCLDGGMERRHVITETRWGKDLTARGYPPIKTRHGNRRQLRIRPRTAFGFTAPEGGGLGGNVEGQWRVVSQPSTGSQPSETGHPSADGGGYGGLDPFEGPTRVHTHTRTRAHEAPVQNDPPPSIPSTLPAPPCEPARPGEAHSARITEKLLAGRERSLTRAERSVPNKARRSATVDDHPSRRGEKDPDRRARHQDELDARAADKTAARAAKKAAELAERIAAAAGEHVELPAVVTRDGSVRHVPLAEAVDMLQAFGAGRELTVDVEHTGYPIGHANYRLRTIQIGSEHLAVVLDAADPDQAGAAGALLEHADVLHAHSATADLVPLATAGLIDIDRAWPRMHDTVIPAKLADPTTTSSDPDLKNLARAVLGTAALSPAADESRAALFKAGKWLTKTDATTPIERSGWAQTDPGSATMARYAGADVLDAAALAARLPRPPAAIHHRERTAQAMTARVAHRGLRIDGDHVDELRARERADLDDAAARLRALEVDNPGSDQQIAKRARDLGADLPLTRTGRLSVAASALTAYRRAAGPLGDLVRARLDYQKAETALGLFLEPYHQLVTHGDGRARPTVYTLAADTGRMSCVRPNLQQVPREGGYRACVTADPGQLLVSADFAGVELRVAAALSGDSNLRAIIADPDRDLHWEVARLAFGPGATKADRYASKRGVFGRIYGGGIPAIARGVGVTETIAAAIVDSLDALLPELTAWSNHMRDAVRRGHTQYPTYSGRVVHFDQRQPHKAPNYAIQGTARELLIDALMRLADTPYGDTTLLPVHDELVLLVDEDRADDATRTLVDAMTSELAGVPIRAEAADPAFAWPDSV